MEVNEKTPFKCEICDAHVSVKSSVKSHNHVHERKRSFKCEICSSTFEDHIASIHKGKMPFKCDACFLTRQSFKYHISSVHEKNIQVLSLR